MMINKSQLYQFAQEFKYYLKKRKSEESNSNYFGKIKFIELHLKACPICKTECNTLIKFSFSLDESIDKYFCKKCHHIFSSYAFEFFESESYDFKEYYPFGEAKLAKTIIKIARAHGQKLNNILYIGSGGNQGLLEKYICKNANVFYSDLKQVRECKNFIPFDELPTCGMTFDAICSRAVIEHIEDPFKAFIQWRNLLAKNGYMAHSFPTTFHNDFFNPMIGIRSHVSIFSKQSLNELTINTGFELLDLNRSWLLSGYTHPTYYFKKK